MTECDRCNKPAQFRVRRVMEILDESDKVIAEDHSADSVHFCSDEHYESWREASRFGG